MLDCDWSSDVCSSDLEREGPAARRALDGYGFAFAEYRRRVDAIGLWTRLAAASHVRTSDAPTYHLFALLYEDIDRIHLRFGGQFGYAGQATADGNMYALRASGLVEYSQRFGRFFYVLPRLGYDGYYPSVTAPPRAPDRVDDDVYNAYRFRHPTLLFAQLLSWLTPTFNTIFYQRSRATFDPTARELLHVALREGLFLAFGPLDLQGYADVTWFNASQASNTRPHVDVFAGASATVTAFGGLGSFGVQPGVAGTLRASDGEWQVRVFVNLLASFRRGLRDFSSLELDFPEQLGGGVPWRGHLPGGYR
jgi:hypothetical protein